MLNLCEKCHRNRNLLWQMMGEPDGTDNEVMAQNWLANCRECKEYIVTRAHNLLAEIR